MQAAGTSSVDNVVQLYGDLIFDLCESILWSSSQAQNAFRAIIKEVKKTPATDKFTTHERAWILSIAFDKLKKFSLQYGRKVSASEQIQLEANQNAAARLKHFDVYFHRLTTEEQIVLLLRDKYGLPYAEIASAMSRPEGTLKSIRSQALRTLEEWLWEL
jgi:DNA-directed RNA polymerase specialized sigma24 family protein